MLEEVEDSDDQEHEKRVHNFGHHPLEAAKLDFVCLVKVAIFKHKIEPNSTGAPRPKLEGDYKR